MLRSLLLTLLPLAGTAFIVPGPSVAPASSVLVAAPAAAFARVPL